MALNINELMRMSEEEAKLNKVSTDSKDKLYIYLKEHPSTAFTVKEVSKALNVPSNNIYSRLKNFIKRGLIGRKGSYIFYTKREA
jgi:predicted transcriptional regulator